MCRATIAWRFSLLESLQTLKLIVKKFQSHKVRLVWDFHSIRIFSKKPKFLKLKSTLHKREILKYHEFFPILDFEGNLSIEITLQWCEILFVSHLFPRINLARCNKNMWWQRAGYSFQILTNKTWLLLCLRFLQSWTAQYLIYVKCKFIFYFFIFFLTICWLKGLCEKKYYLK